MLYAYLYTLFLLAAHVFATNEEGLAFLAENSKKEGDTFSRSILSELRIQHISLTQVL